MALVLRSRGHQSEDTAKDAVLLEMDTLDVFLDLLDLLLLSAPLLASEVVHEEAFLRALRIVLEEEESELSGTRLEASNDTQSVLLHLVAELFVNSVTDVSQGALLRLSSIASKLDLSDDKFFSERGNVNREPSVEGNVLDVH